MAKIYSHSQGKAKGSVGLTTYRTVRGRVIESQKVTPFEPGQESRGGTTRFNLRTALLGMISVFASAHAQSIKNSFDKTKYGSERNMFYKLNFAELRKAFSVLLPVYIGEKQCPSIEVIEAALAAYAYANPGKIVRISKRGVPKTYLDGAWDDSKDPVIIKVSEVVASIDEDTAALSLSISGSNLMAGVALYDGNVAVAGSFVGSDTHADFVADGTPKFYGAHNFRLMHGSDILKEFSAVGPELPQMVSVAISIPTAMQSMGNVQIDSDPAGKSVSKQVEPGTQVTLKATPVSNDYQFNGWSDGNNDPTRVMTANENISLTAAFAPNE